MAGWQEFDSTEKLPVADNTQSPEWRCNYR